MWSFLRKLEIELPYDPGIPLLGIHTKETRIERETCTPMFIATLFIIARTWKQPRCPSADEWIRKLWYIYTVEYYSAIKKNAFESVLTYSRTPKLSLWQPHLLLFELTPLLINTQVKKHHVKWKAGISFLDHRDHPIKS